MREMLDVKLKRFEELEAMLLDPEVLANSRRLAGVAREHGSIAKLVNKYRRFQELNAEVTEMQELQSGNDSDLAELAEAELPDIREEREKLWAELLDMTIGGEDSNRTRCIMEIRAGAGGSEAALFARDLYEMYRHYCEAKKWKVGVIDSNATELGGFKDVSLEIQGDGVFRALQFESGGHRVQRVPETEAKGRIHTSAATVAIMPEPEDVEIEVSLDDCRVDKFHASGPGGQHVNKTASAIRLTHLETGAVVSCQDGKSQHKNLAQALRVLKARLYEAKREEEHQKRADDRKTKIGSGDRSQRIRTYNFPENRLTDHRIGFTIYKLTAILQGDLDLVIDELLEHERQDLRSSFGALN